MGYCDRKLPLIKKRFLNEYLPFLNCTYNITHIWNMELNGKSKLEFLLIKFLRKNSSPEEKEDLFRLLSSPDNERIFKDALFAHLSEFDEDQYIQNDVDFNPIYDKIISEIKFRELWESEKEIIKSKTRVRKLIIQGFALAAVFCIAFALGNLLKQNENKDLKYPVPAVSYSEIKAPLGARSEVKLADGTTVILNAGSTLSYSNRYNLDNRNLILRGEAYFKVSKNATLPLIVNAGNIDIKATGTEFNVKAYIDEGIIETTLIEGTVEISQKGNHGEDKILKLKPNQKAIYIQKLDRVTLGKIKELAPIAIKSGKIITDKILISPKADVDQVTAWTQNKLIIRGENLENLCIKLQRKYNVTFIFGNEEIKKYRFSGVLFDETLEQVLNVIKLTAPINYVLDGKNVLMVSNKEETEKFSKQVKKENNPLTR
jgi:transmembrane sensor